MWYLLLPRPSYWVGWPETLCTYATNGLTSSYPFLYVTFDPYENPLSRPPSGVSMYKKRENPASLLDPRDRKEWRVSFRVKSRSRLPIVRKSYHWAMPYPGTQFLTHDWILLEEIGKTVGAIDAKDARAVKGRAVQKGAGTVVAASEPVAPPIEPAAE